MTENNSKRNYAESDVNHRISNEAKKRRNEDHQQVVSNEEYLTMTAEYTFIQVCTGNTLTLNEENVLQRNGRG